MKSWESCTKRERVERWEQVLRVLRALTPHQRRKHWDMGIFGRKTECGTVACAAGHCGLDTWFRRRGFTMNIQQDGWTDIPNPNEFFGAYGSNRVFFNVHLWTVGQVMREVRAYIKQLRAE